jgi:uncharacterized beta-barrel protein YwiB (DUF1934 family)
MKGRIAITSQGNGWNNNIISPAEIVRGESGVTVHYSIEGDKCTLEVSNDCVVQTRKGKADLHLTFRQGEQTACIIGDVSLAGGYKIFTERMKVVVGKSGCFVNLIYFSGDDGEKISLKITAVTIG